MNIPEVIKLTKHDATRLRAKADEAERDGRVADWMKFTTLLERKQERLAELQALERG